MKFTLALGGIQNILRTWLRPIARVALEAVGLTEMVVATAMARAGLHEPLPLFSVAHFVCRDKDGNVKWEHLEHNLVTNAGRAFFSAQAYGSSPGANGLNYIGTSADPLTETAASTSLSSENNSNGFTRQQGTITQVGSLATTTTTDTGGAGFDNTSATSGNVTSAPTASIVPGSLLLVDSELIIVSGVSGNAITMTSGRGAYGTAGAAHASSSTVTNVNTTVITYTFTATGAITVQKAGLFNASSSGTMGHVASTGGSRTLASTDTLAITFYVCGG